MPNVRTVPQTAKDVLPPEDTFLFRVLLEVPKALYIPIFGLRAEAARRASEVAFSSDVDALRNVLSGNTSHALTSGRYGTFMLIDRRDRVGRTAVYSRWLGFPGESGADGFLRDYPRFGFDQIQQRTQKTLSDKERQLQNGAASGRYNLGPLEHQARLNRATEYLRVSEEVEKLRDNVSALQVLRATLGTAPAVVSVG